MAHRPSTAPARVGRPLPEERSTPMRRPSTSRRLSRPPTGKKCGAQLQRYALRTAPAHRPGETLLSHEGKTRSAQRLVDVNGTFYAVPFRAPHRRYKLADRDGPQFRPDRLSVYGSTFGVTRPTSACARRKPLVPYKPNAARNVLPVGFTSRRSQKRDTLQLGSNNPLERRTSYKKSVYGGEYSLAGKLPVGFRTNPGIACMASSLLRRQRDKK